MRKFVYRLHLWLGAIVALPVLAWAVSGLIYSLPNRVEGGKVDVVDSNRVKIAPADAMLKANQFANRQLPITALTLLMRDGKPVYQAVGGMGAESLLIDAQTGDVVQTPPPNAATRFFRQAHFYYFAGSWQVPLLILMSALAALSALTGIYLNLNLWFGK